MRAIDRDANGCVLGSPAHLAFDLYHQFAHLDVMATTLLAKQVQSKWKNSFARLNRGEPGITGLLAFSEVCLPPLMPPARTTLNGCSVSPIGMENRNWILVP